MNDDLISRQAVLELSWRLDYPDYSDEEVVNVRDIKDLSSVIPTDSVIDDIKADIEKEKELYNTDVSVNYIDYGIKIGLNVALNIINKHIGGDADESNH